MFFSCTIVAATFLYPSLLPNYSFTMSIITFPFIFQLLVKQTLPLMSLFLPHKFLPLQTAWSLSAEVRPLTPSVTANSNITFKLLRETIVCLCIDVYLDIVSPMMLYSNLGSLCPSHIEKRVSDQRLAELETLLAMAVSNRRMSDMPVGFGLIDPHVMWVKTSGHSLLLIVMSSEFGHALCSRHL